MKSFLIFCAAVAVVFVSLLLAGVVSSLILSTSAPAAPMENISDIKIGDMVAFDFSCDYFEDLDRRHPLGKCYYVNRERQAMFLGVVKSVDTITNKIKVDVYGTQTTRWGQPRLNQFTEYNHVFKLYFEN